MTIPIADRVEKRRQALRASGLRPLQIWTPDTRRPGFAEACRVQSERVAAADAADQDLLGLGEAAWLDVDKGCG